MCCLHCSVSDFSSDIFDFQRFISKMVLLTSMLYLTNLLCGFVSCQWKWAPTDSYIDNNLISERTGRKLTASVNSYPTVTTNSGLIQGYSMGTTSGRRIFAFEGIPYAEPPIGNRRFRAPTAKAPWVGTMRAMRARENCLQFSPMNLGRVLGTEDCLYLNIYSPALPDDLDNPSYPVVIFIHGGSYYFGGGSEYGPAYLLNQDVILVTISFRQGVLGYLSSGDKESPGNYGLKDQALAMKWVHENIARFGGDPARVMLMGQSSGGCMVHMHMIGNKTRSYFQSAFSLSGTAFNHWSWQPREVARSRTVKLAKLFFCPTETSKEMMSCLRHINPAFVVANVLNLYELIPLPMILFAPTIEDANDPEAFLTETPVEAYRRGAVAKKPWAVSVVTEEGVMSLYLLRLTMTYHATRRNIWKYLPLLLEFKYVAPRTEWNSITNKIWQFYHGNTQPREAPNDFISDMATDRYFMNGIQKAIQVHSEIAPTYPMIFAYKGRFNSGGSLMGAAKQDLGLGHCEDVYYYFNASVFADGYKIGEPEYELTQILANLLHNYAAKGEPYYTDINGTVKIWDSVTDPSKLRFLRIDREIRMVANPYNNRLTFWESLGLTDTTKW